MQVTNVHISTTNKWMLIIEGMEKGRNVSTYCAIPPTSGNRVDILTPDVLDTGYRYDVNVIVVDIKHGVPWVHLFI